MLGKKKRTSDSDDSKSWYKDRYQSAVFWRNLLSVITVMSLLVAAVAGFAVLQLAPLKSVEPFVIQIDENSGITQVVDPMTTQSITGDKAINNYFLVQYIRARESYDVTSFIYNQNVVALMSDKQKVFPQYRAFLSTDNPASPLVRLQQAGKRSVKIQSISYLDTRKVLVKFTITEELGDRAQRSNKVTLIEFQYANIELNAEQRYTNPLGFLVTSYSVDEDTIQQ